jgi:Tol biopolymer transport system component
MLTRGTKLGVYEVISSLGAGGMGEVYRARDTKLGRDVAVKILPDTFASDPERLARFEREARTLAALNHPHIAHIYGMEGATSATPWNALVMELVEGEDLAQWIERGPIPLDEALPIARQIAEALEAAHEQGIVHRDLKPANIKLRPDGTVKVLDFGLAKMYATAKAGALTALGDAEGLGLSPATSPTLTSPANMTVGGMILGTAAYMAPEQAKGKPIDRRADIWAFGCVLYEMLTGHAAFTGDSVTHTLARVIEGEPDWSALPATTPAHVARLVRRCLRKDVTRRWQHIGDARVELTEPEPQAVEQAAFQPASRRLHVAYAAAIATLGAIAIGLFAWQRSATATAPPPIAQLEFSLPSGVDFFARAGGLAISPDSSQIAYVASQNGTRQIFLRPLAGTDARPVPRTESAVYTAFSPDGRSIAYVSVDRSVNIVSLSDGVVTPLPGDADYSSPAWGPEGAIVYTRNNVLWRAPTPSAQPVQLTTLDVARGEVGHRQPFVLPTGAVLFTSFAGNPPAARVEVVTPSDGGRRVLIQNASAAFYARQHVIFARGSALLAVPFDLEEVAVSGAERTILPDVATRAGFPIAAVAANGTIAYLPRRAATARLLWVTRTGVETPINDTPRNYIGPRISPDGRKIAVYVDDDADAIWLHDVERQTFTRAVSGGSDGFVTAAVGWIVWTPQADRMIYRTPSAMWSVDTVGGADARKIESSTGTDFPNAVSPDGDTLVYTHNEPGMASDIYMMSLSGKFPPKAVLATRAVESNAHFSADGRYLAYTSNESGRSEVYLRSFPQGDRKWQVSIDGGSHLVWSRDGKTLFFRDRARHVMAVDVVTSPDVKLSVPRVLLEDRYTMSGYTSVANYDVSPDGQRFAVVRDDGAVRIGVLVNYFDELLSKSAQ